MLRYITDIPLLPQRHYSFAHEKEPYAMQDITSELRGNETAN